MEKNTNNGAILGFESKLWEAADKPRSNMDAAEYKRGALGLIFLKYISDSFEEHFKHLDAEVSNPGSEWHVTEIDRTAQSVFSFECKLFPNKSITSVRAKRVHNWMLSLAKQSMRESER